MPMYNACPEDNRLTHILRTGEPPQQKYPEREDVEVVELSDENYAEIIENRSKQTKERKGAYYE